MSSYDDTVYHPSPASSSGAVDSFGGTPHTSLTAFSPEDVRAMKSAPVNLGDEPTRSSQQDPFVSSGTQIGGRLSARASAFQPSFEVTAATPAAPSTIMQPSKKMQAPKPSDNVENLCGAQSPNGAPDTVNCAHFGAFTTDSNTSRVLKVTGKDAVAIFLPLVEATKKKVREIGNAKRGSERSESLGNSYYLRLSNIRDATELYAGIKRDNLGLIVEYVSPVTFGKLFSPGGYSVHEGQVLLTVNHPSDVKLDDRLVEISLIQMLEGKGKLCAWHKVQGTENGTFYMLAEFEDASYAAEVVTSGRKINNNLKLQNVSVSVDMFRPDLAEQVLLQQMYPPATPTRYSGEHTDLNDAFGNVSLDNFDVFPDGAGDIHVGISPNAPGTPYMGPPSGYPMSNTPTFLMGGLGRAYMPPIANSFQQAYAPGVGHQVNPSPGGSLFPSSREQDSYPQGRFPQRSFESGAVFQQAHLNNGFNYYNHRLHERTPDFGHFSRLGGRRQYIPMSQHMRTRQHSGPANSHHNHVDIAKIRQGIDVRTTVMLRNIPNKVDQAMLKEIVDESSFGRYDFMYLRIDFSNNCNVGYAFINFTDPLDIVDFVIARSNQKWHRFKSDKVAEVSYATIQGKDCLVQKFRNSSVMLEPPHYRPKLFKTIHDPFGCAGEEERFPESDNASKLKRSCENAEHVGLFAPSAGQHLRDEQRRRRSQYDRGTSLAEREENGFDDPLYNQFGLPPC